MQAGDVEAVSHTAAPPCTSPRRAGVKCMAASRSRPLAAQVLFAARPGAAPATAACFRVAEHAVAGPLADGHVRCRTAFLSVDPYLRCRMDAARTVEYTGGYEVGKVMTSSGVGEVVESRHPAYTPGTMVFSHEWPWQHVADLPGKPPADPPAYLKPVLPWVLSQLVDPSPLWRPVVARVAPTLMAATLDPLRYDVKELSPSLVLSVLGMPGITAYTGMMKCADPPPGATVLISGAAGAVGMVAGQLAARHPSRSGMKVVGIAGGAKKCDVLVHKLGFTAAVDYKAALQHGGYDCLAERILEACGGGADVYFDNVGGGMSDTIIQRNMASGGKVVVCGQIANYENENAQTYPDPLTPAAAARVDALALSRVRFNILHYFSYWAGAVADLEALVRSGAVDMPETTVHGLENAGAAFVSMMQGGNVGKMVVQV
eukprot:TRINITY_DN8671_c0_g1_i1.p2 TRINITY_DN8671_c0_g1~~TRINITY_DN8671_c0_g1_i1.p2  ORF type:complete len:439 (+),score=95.08 TRINITY_DN8671_c0_g1_i1:25-1317(+)